VYSCEIPKHFIPNYKEPKGYAYQSGSHPHYKPSGSIEHIGAEFTEDILVIPKFLFHKLDGVVADHYGISQEPTANTKDTDN
jgi:hypothetical protein